MAVRWIVESGWYSDYGVVCVCDSEERAKALAARLNAESRDGDYRAATVTYVDYDQWDLITVYCVRTFCNAEGSLYAPSRWHYTVRPWEVPPPVHEWRGSKYVAPWELTVIDTDEAQAEAWFRHLAAAPPGTRAGGPAREE